MTHEVLFLSRVNIEATGFTMREVISAVEQAFREKGEGRAEMPPKPGIHPAPDAFIHAMPAYLPGLHAAGIKWVSGYPENYKRGLPYISGLVVLNEPETGLPLAILDGAWITAKRTGAVTAVAAKHLARKDSRTIGILGLGVQGRSNLEALTEVLPNLQVVKTYDALTRNQEKYVEEMTALTKLSIQSAKTPLEAVADCDIIVTAGPIHKDPEPVIESEWLKEGVFACPVDFDSYWKPAAMHSMNKFLTDDTEQLLYYKSLGYFKDIPRTYANLEEIVLGRKPARENTHERIMSMNLGLAIEDIAVAARLFERAKRTGSGEWLSL